MISKEEATAIARAEIERRGVECGPPHKVFGLLRYTVAADTEPIGATVFVRVSRRDGRVLAWQYSRWPRRGDVIGMFRRWREPKGAEPDREGTGPGGPVLGRDRGD